MSPALAASSSTIAKCVERFWCILSLSLFFPSPGASIASLCRCTFRVGPSDFDVFVVVVNLIRFSRDPFPWTGRTPSIKGRNRTAQRSFCSPSACLGCRLKMDWAFCRKIFVGFVWRHHYGMIGWQCWWQGYDKTIACSVFPVALFSPHRYEKVLALALYLRKSTIRSGESGKAV